MELNEIIVNDTIVARLISVGLPYGIALGCVFSIFLFLSISLGVDYFASKLKAKENKGV